MKSPCDKCHKDPCGCPEPFLDAYFRPYDPLTLTLNDNGKTTEVSLENAINKGQTDTSLIADIIDRLLRFKAERHIDTITASELGSILHLSDLGDVSTKGVEQGSILVHKKNDYCAEGCVGTHNIWEPWNAVDGAADTAYYVMGFAKDGTPTSLSAPAKPSNTYFLGWNGKDQVSYFTVNEAASAPARGGQVYFDETTGQLTYVRGK